MAEISTDIKSSSPDESASATECMDGGMKAVDTVKPKGERTGAGSSRAFIRCAWRNTWVRALLIACLVIFFVWQRGIWANYYQRAFVRYEIGRKSGDYRSTGSFDTAGYRVKIQYPFYWATSSENGRLKFQALRFTKSVNEMTFERLPSPGKAAWTPPTGSDVEMRDDTTLGGERMTIYRYGVGDRRKDGYQNTVVAVFPKAGFKVTMVQYYEMGPYVEDDIAMTRMYNVLYGLKFQPLQ